MRKVSLLLYKMERASICYMRKIRCTTLHIACMCSVAQSCLTLYNSKDCSLPGSSVHGISQARILEWVGISYSKGSSQPRDQTHNSYVSCTGRWVLYQCATQGIRALIKNRKVKNVH